MQVTKQLIDEFESEFVDLMRLFEGLKYNFSTESYLDAWGFCPDDAVTLNICLEVWLKQREKQQKFIGTLRKIVSGDIELALSDWLKELEAADEALQASQPQEQGE